MSGVPSSRRSITAVLLKTTLPIVALALATGELSLVLMTAGLRAALAIGLAMLSVQVAGVALLLTWLLVVKVVHGIADHRVQRLSPLIQEQLAQCALGLSTKLPMTELYRHHRREFETCLLDFLPTIVGSQRQRLAAVAQELGLLKRWERQYHSSAVRLRAIGLIAPASPILLDALADSRSLFRIEAAQALVTSGEPALVEQVFLSSLSEDLLARAMIGVAMLPAVPMLSKRLLPLLNELPPLELGRALELAWSWQRGIEIAGLFDWARHSDPQVRARSIALLPYSALADEGWSTLLTALKDPVPEVRIAACRAAGRSRLSVVEVVAAGLSEEDPRLRLASAFSLAHLGEPGANRLESEVRMGSIAANQALEALEKLRLGRLADLL
jgi:hypothetical protein